MGNFTPSQLEEISVDEIKRLIRKHKNLKSNISQKDKEPSWDGYIYVYSEENTEKKDKILGKIPVQVKGTEVKKFKNKLISFPIEISDLNNYFNDGGIIYFVVEINEDETCRVFYRILLPVDLKLKLDEAREKGNKATINIKIDNILNENNDFSRKCNEFLIHKSNQGVQVVNNAVPIEKLKSNELEIISMDNPLTILNKELYTYTRDNLGHRIPILSKLIVSEIMYTLERTISVNKIKYFNNYIIRNGKDQYIQFGDNIILNFKRSNITISKSENNFKDRLITLLFYKEMIINKGFNINDILIPISIINLKKQIEEIEEEINLINRIIEVCKKFNINFDKLSLKNFTNSDLDSLNMLESVEDNYIGNFPINENSFCLIKFLNNNIILWKIISYDKKYYINYYSEKNTMVLKSHDNYNEVNFSRFIVLKNHMLNCCNFDKDVIIESLNRLYDEKASADYILFALELIKTWDDSKRACYLELANFIFDLIEADKGNDIVTINKAQIEFRLEGKLSYETKDKLYEIKIKTSDNSIKAAIEILIGNISAYNKYFNLLNDDTKKEFKKFPIYNLYLDLYKAKTNN